MMKKLFAALTALALCLCGVYGAWRQATGGSKMKLDVSKAFVRPMEDFPFEATVVLEAQDVNGDQVSFEP